jgi:hypothetical protein
MLRWLSERLVRTAAERERSSDAEGSEGGST